MCVLFTEDEEERGIRKITALQPLWSPKIL